MLIKHFGDGDVIHTEPELEMAHVQKISSGILVSPSCLRSTMKNSTLPK